MRNPQERAPAWVLQHANRSCALANGCATTSYTSLVRPPGDREKYVILCDQLAQGWVGPPGDGRHGQLHDADTISAMGFTVPPPR